MDTRFKHPFTCLVAGPSGCGKTVLLQSILHKKDLLIDPPVEQVIWYYGTWQSLFDSIPEVEFVEGLPDLKSLNKDTRKLIIIDDLMQETDQRVSQLFTKYSHHHNISCFYIVQALFNKNKENRVISLNAHYMILFKSPRDKSQIMHLARQMYPGQSRFLQDVFEEATSRPYGYLLVDLKQDTPEHLRLRSHLTQDVQFVYIRKV